MTEERRDWRELCAAITREKDSAKLLQFMEELLAVLEERQTFVSMGNGRNVDPENAGKV